MITVHTIKKVKENIFNVQEHEQHGIT